MNDLHSIAAQVGTALKARGQMLATAESCTGGAIAQALTSVPGSSRWFDRGFVAYSNPSKQQMLGVNEATLEAFGAVSEAAVREMALGALGRSDAQVSVAVSGIAGPEGGTPEKPVGTVWLAWAIQDGGTRARRYHFPGDRAEIRQQAVIAALSGLLEIAAEADKRGPSAGRG